MKNSTTIKIPKKYQHMIDEVLKDQDGYWVYLKDGYYSPTLDCGTIHEDTIKDVLKEIRKIEKNG